MSDTNEEIVLIAPPQLNRESIDKLVGTKVSDISLYQRAFTHKSALKEDETLSGSFETLEFIGDSVLGFVITKFEYLYMKSFILSICTLW